MHSMKILVLETVGLHLGYLGCYGNDWIATPTLDQLATEGVVFDQHFADDLAMNQTPSFLTGVYPWVGLQNTAPIAFRHQKIENLEGFGQDALLAVAGWLEADEPILWIEGPSLFPPWDLPEDLLAIYFEDEANAQPIRNPDSTKLPWTTENLNRLQNSYASAVTFWDAQLAVMVDAFREEEMLDYLWICVTSRCGFALGEHGNVGNASPKIYSEMAHLPLVMRLWHGDHAGERVSALTQPIDLYPTFREALKLPSHPTWGRSAWSLIRGEADSIRPYALGRDGSEREETWSLRTSDSALITFPTPRETQLYLKPEDLWEAVDLSQVEPERTARTEIVLKQARDAISQGFSEYPGLSNDSTNNAETQPLQ